MSFVESYISRCPYLRELSEVHCIILYVSRYLAYWLGLWGQKVIIIHCSRAELNSYSLNLKIISHSPLLCIQANVCGVINAWECREELFNLAYILYVQHNTMVALLMLPHDIIC
jgi:hypothetical protein